MGVPLRLIPAGPQHNESKNADSSPRHTTDRAMLFDVNSQVKLTSVQKSELIVACSDGAVGRVKELLAKGADVNEVDESGKTLLHIAVEHGHESVIEELLLSDAIAVNARDVSQLGWTPLHTGARTGNKTIVSRLLARGADPNVRAFEDEKLPLHVACEAGNLKVAECLIPRTDSIDAPARRGQTPLHLAAERGERDIAELLLYEGAEVNACMDGEGGSLQMQLVEFGGDFYGGDYGPTALHLAVRNGHTNTADLLIFNGALLDALADQCTPLHLASAKGQLECVKLLIRKRGNITATTAGEGYTALHLAAKSGQREIAQELLLASANVNSLALGDGLTPLHLAAKHDAREVADVLIKHGATVNAMAKNLTPLHYAAEYGKRSDTSKLLISKGAEVNAKTQVFATALHLAAEHGHLDTAELLVRKGAKLDAKTRSFSRPIDLAQRNGHDDIVELLSRPRGCFGSLWQI